MSTTLTIGDEKENLDYPSTGTAGRFVTAKGL